MAQAADKRPPILRAAPIGVIAYGINGYTLYTSFKLKIRKGKGPKKYEDLSPTNLNAIQARYTGIDYILLDEKSIVSL